MFYILLNVQVSGKKSEVPTLIEGNISILLFKCSLPISIQAARKASEACFQTKLQLMYYSLNYWDRVFLFCHFAYENVH